MFEILFGVDDKWGGGDLVILIFRKVLNNRQGFLCKSFKKGLL